MPATLDKPIHHPKLNLPAQILASFLWSSLAAESLSLTTVCKRCKGPETTLPKVFPGLREPKLRPQSPQPFIITSIRASLPTMPQPTASRVPLDILLHAVFIHTANIFNDPRKHNPRATANTNSVPRVNIPTLIDRFQYALDLLEAEILRAKATLRRDLEVLRQRAEEAKVVAEQEGEENRAKGMKEERANQGQNEKETSEKVGADQQQRLS